MRIDLHCHTTASDGMLAPTELVSLAKRSAIDVIGVTDHDTVEGVDEAVRAGVGAGVRVVAGIELSTRTDERSVHVLGYFLDPSAPALAELGDRMRAERLDRMERMVRRLNELGYELTTQEVMAQAKGTIVARPHVARALVARGYIDSVRDAFSPELIADGGLADVPRRQPSPADAIEVIAAAGGVAVIAHPGLRHHLGTHDPVSEQLIAQLARGGLAGLEVEHPDHDAPAKDWLRSLARRLGLVCTGGSDFHGETERRLGAGLTNAESFAELEARATAAG